MMRQRMVLFVNGKQKEWMFQFDGDPAHIEGWKADGLNVELAGENLIPAWVAELGLVTPWIWSISKHRRKFGVYWWLNETRRHPHSLRDRSRQNDARR